MGRDVQVKQSSPCWLEENSVREYKRYIWKCTDSTWKLWQDQGSPGGEDQEILGRYKEMTRQSRNMKVMPNLWQNLPKGRLQEDMQHEEKDQGGGVGNSCALWMNKKGGRKGKWLSERRGHHGQMPPPNRRCVAFENAFSKVWRKKAKLHTINQLNILARRIFLSLKH